jgi:hypothetical protein
MKIEFVKQGDQYEIKMVGRLDECDVMINALENSVQDSPNVREATSFLRKKFSFFRR